jgi:putative RecB family exonuclease
MFTPPNHLSPSSIRLFRDCPQKFKLSKFDKIQEPPTWQQYVGTFVHDVLEHLYQVEAEERTVDRVRELAATRWEAGNWEAQVLALAEPLGSIKDFKLTAFQCMKNLWSIENPQDIELDGMEHKVEANVEGVQMLGFIDRFIFEDDGAVAISDYKTGKVPSSKFTTQNEEFFQLLAYALMLQEADQETTSRLQLLYLKEPVVHEISVTPVNLAVAKGVIVETKESLDASCGTGEFHCNVTKLCDWCYFKKSGDCPAFKK